MERDPNTFSHCFPSKKMDQSVCHDRIFFRALHLSVKKSDSQIRKYRFLERFSPDLGRFQRFQIAFFHSRADNIHLVTRLTLFSDKCIAAFPFILSDQECVNRLPSRRQLIQNRDIQISVGNQRKCARDRGRRHDKKMRRIALFIQRCPLGYAEAVLLICNDKPQVGKNDVLRQQSMDAITAPVSLYEPVYTEGGDPLTVMDQVRDQKNTDEQWLESIALREAIHGLSEREKRILALRFYDGKTQMEVAGQIGISQAQVSRLEKNALGSIRKAISLS